MTIDPPPQSGCLRHLGVLRFTGPDSLSFLQGQVSNDTRRLTQSQSLLAAYSSPQGRVLALMHLMPRDGGVIAVLPRELVSPTLDALRRFVLRAKVAIEDASEALSVAGVHGPRSVPASGEDVLVSAVNRDSERHWVIGAAERLAEYPLAHDPARARQVEHDWRLADIRAGLPQIYLATRESFVAQMLNLDLLDGISFSKGCYTGQEIIARTQHLGRIKRRLYRLGLPRGDWTLGQPLRLNDGRTGRLVEVIDTGDGFEALAVLTVESANSEGEPSAGHSVAAIDLPLPYELSRPG
jgi:folate-binding protein YgfZ